jgi:hypothetical protein
VDDRPFYVCKRTGSAKSRPADDSRETIVECVVAEVTEPPECAPIRSLADAI